MPVSLKFYQDQLLRSSTSALPLQKAHRIIYVRHGSIIANGETLARNQFAYHQNPLYLSGNAALSEIWRWELSAPNDTPHLILGSDTLSLLKIAHVITTLEVEPGTNWLFRLDSVTSAAGRITPRHRHKGPGIRCLYQGTFNVQGQAYPTENMAPGDAWWESGEETVVAWHSNQMPAIFIRGLLLPTDIKGYMSNIWETGVASPKSNWQLLIDQEVTI